MKVLSVFRDKCRHFNGIQNPTCKASVSYADVRSPKELADMQIHPCLDLPMGARTRCPDTCPSRSWLTQEEHEAHERELKAAVQRLVSNLEAGICNTCGSSVEPSRVIGRCRYAACGHRIGQVSR